MSSFLILMLQLQETTEQHSSVVPVRAGQDVTLHCKNVIQKQHECNSTDWLFSGSGSSVTLFELGQIHKYAKTKSDRLSVTANCSLVIKKVTSEDAGRYICRQIRTRAGPQEGPDSVIDLSVINNVKTTKSTTTVKVKTSEGTPTAESKQSIEDSLLRCIFVSVGLAALLTSVVTVNMWTKAKEKKTEMEENSVLNDEDEGPVSYENIGDPSASVRFH